MLKGQKDTNMEFNLSISESGPQSGTECWDVNATPTCMPILWCARFADIVWRARKLSM